MGAVQVRQAARDLEEAVGGLVVDEVPVVVAGDLVELLARCERVVSCLRVRLGRRVTEAGGHRASGDRDGAAYLSRVSGSPRARARAELELAERLEELPEVERAVAAGRVSTDQAKVIVPAVTANPRATEELLAAAKERSFAELKDLAARTARTARLDRDEVARERRVHLRRYCRTWVPEDGGLRIDAWVTTLDGAKLLAALAKKTDQLLGCTTDPVERLRADALVALVAGEHVTTEVHLRVDAAALVRGEVEDGEACEVAGLGPLSVRKARSLLGEAFLTLLVTRGADITTVTSTTRVVPRRVRKALFERDRTCVVPGCGIQMHLEIDHWRCDFAKGGLTELDNLCRLCSVHHRLKTEGLLHLEGGPGKWFVTTKGARAGPGPVTARRPSVGPHHAPSGGRPPPRRRG